MGQRKRWTVDLSVVDPTWANWADPVVLRLGAFCLERVDNPAEALIFLHHRWPSMRGAQAEQAAKLCSQVLRRRVKPDLAREAFVAAADEAEILCQSRA